MNYCSMKYWRSYYSNKVAEILLDIEVAEKVTFEYSNLELDGLEDTPLI